MKRFLTITLMFTFLFLLVEDSFARAGKGSSSGFRSYKMQDFNRVNKSPSQPSPYGQKQVQNQPSYQPQTKPSFFSNPIFKWLIGGMIFGALLSLLLGHGFNIGMPGLLEILLILGVVYFIFKMISKKKEEPAYATSTPQISNPVNKYSANAVSTEPYINEELILNLAKNAFIDIQRAWSNGDLSPVKNFMTDRMYLYLNSQLQDLKSKGLKNVIEDLKILDANIVHVEEEGDNKVVIVEIEAEGKDYTLDSQGNVVDGDKHNPVVFKEYWAFVGKALNWKLDDIKQVQDV